MRKENFYFSTIFIVLLTLNSCKTSNSGAAYYSYKTECLESNLDGTQTVKAWGKGENKTKALEQAKKNALQEIIFQGIRQGSTNCESRPLVPQVNADSKYESYFIKFFKGDYSKFVSVINVNTSEVNNSNTYLVGTTLTIKVADLKQRLFDDNIISNPN